mgnify:CR=1 FL=1
MEHRFRSGGIKESEFVLYGFIPKLKGYGQFIFKISVSACTLRLCLPIIIWINIKSLPFNQVQKLVISSISFQLANTDINPFVGNPFLRWPARVKFFFDPTELHISCGYPNFKCRLGYFINLNSKGGMIMNFSKAGRCCLDYHRANSKKKILFAPMRQLFLSFAKILVTDPLVKSPPMKFWHF